MVTRNDFDLLIHLGWARILMVLPLFMCSLPAMSQESPPSPKRWAIIATDEKATALADLLTAELSEWENVHLVERDRIRLALQELNLKAGGLIRSQHTKRFVQLTQADALVLIDAPNDQSAAKSESNNGRLRLVDARTSVRLVDTVLPHADLETQLASVQDDLQKSRITLAIPVDRLRLIGVIPIKSEEPGEQLKSFCQSLTKLVEFRLHQLPEFVVLERTDLIRLLDERNVSGKELDVFAAARLLETGVHRATDGKGIEVTCRLVAPRGGSRETIRLSVASGDLLNTRNEIIRSVGGKLVGKSMEESRRSDPVAEADVFDKRRQWMHSAYRFQYAAEMAEVAYALDPTVDRLEIALQEYRSWRHTHSNRGDRVPKMDGYDRLLADYNSRTLRPKLRDGQSSISAMRAYAFRPLRRGTDEDIRTREKHRVTALALFAQRLTEADSDPNRRFAILLEKLDIAFALAPSNHDFVAQLPKQIDELIATRKEAGMPEKVSDQSYGRFVMSAIRLVTCIDYMMRSDPGLKAAGSLRAQWLDYLDSNDELAIQAARLIRQSQQRGDAGDSASLELVELMRNWEPASGNIASIFENKYRRDALSRITRSDLRNDYLDIILDREQSLKDPHELMRDRVAIQSILASTPRDQQQAVAARITQSLDRFDDSNQGVASPLRESVKNHLIKSGLAESEPPDRALMSEKGIWKSYAMSSIELVDPDPMHNQMSQMYVDHRDDAPRRGGRLIQVWSRRDGPGMTVERVDLATGKITKVGPPISGYPRSFRGVPLAVSPDAVYAATKAPGFTMIKKDSIETFTEQQGAPSNDVWRMAWYKDRLYIAYADALASFDPATKKFSLLASSLSLEPRNLIDGRGSFFVRYLIPDEANDCLWMGIQDNALPRDRNGFWRFEPESNTYTKISGSHVVPCLTDHGFLLHRSAEKPWAHVDRKSGELTVLGNYGCWKNPSHAWQDFVMLGDHILTSRCSLFTPDGKEHKATSMIKWPDLFFVDSGCITQFDKKKNVLWYLERKK